MSEQSERKVHKATELTKKLASSNEGAVIANEVSAVLSSRLRGKEIAPLIQKSAVDFSVKELVYF